MRSHHLLGLVTSTILLSLIVPVPVLLSLGESTVLAQDVGESDRQADADALFQQSIRAGQQGDYQQALGMLQQALVIYRETGNHRGEGLTLRALGAISNRIHQYSQALEYYQQALDVFSELGDRLSESTVLNRMGLIYDNLNQYQQALASYQQALDISSEISIREAFPQESRSEQSNAFNNIAAVYFDLGQYQEALNYFQQALVVDIELGDRRGESTILNNIGAVYDNLGQYQQALASYQQALAIASEIEYPSGEGTALTNIGLVYANLGQYQQALNSHQQALTIFTEIGNLQGEGSALTNIGAAYRHLDQYQQALDAHRCALTIFTEINDRQGQGFAFNNIGSLYDNLGQYEQALDSYHQALLILAELGNRRGEGVTLHGIGLAHQNLGQYEQALEYYQQSITISIEIGDRRGEGSTLHNIGAVYLETGRYADAEQTLFEALAVLESLRDEDLDDVDKVALFETQLNIYELLQQTLTTQGNNEIALEIAERGRARIMVELLTEQASDRLSQEIFSDVPTVEEIQHIAQQQNATLVNYSLINSGVGDPALYIWVVQPDGTIDFVEVPLSDTETHTPFRNPIAQLDGAFYRGISRPDVSSPLVADLRSALGTDRGIELVRTDDAETTNRLQEFHHLLIDPIAHLLPTDPNEKVVFIPQGSLFLIPFAALQDDNGTYLIERHTILTAPSIQVLGLTQDIQASLSRDRVQFSDLTTEEMLIVGNPTMPEAWNPDNSEMEQLSPLPGAEREANAIARFLNTHSLTGDAATETQIRQQIQTARLIHLATHGLLQYGIPQESGVRDIPGAIALAPGSRDDGLLTSAEILTLDLNAELVVLSACDTGRGDIRGDGVIGLSRSLITAGVPSIVVSLWQVPDTPTANLMTEFYRQLQQSPDRAEALRQAMLITMQDHPHPINWAGFTLIGQAN
ncbi:MAG: CHAT domain-containing protein [Elainellaceae cyanobacterium]